MSFAPKFPPFIAACRTHSTKKVLLRVFLAKKVKNISEMEGNSIVCFTVDKENGRAGETTAERDKQNET